MRIDYEGVAARLIIVGRRAGDQPSPRAGAQLDASCDMCVAVGIGRTPFQVRGATVSAIRDAGQRPAFQTTGTNSALKAFDQTLAQTLAQTLEMLP